MRRRSMLLALGALAVTPATAQAQDTITVAPGDTLWGIARANGRAPADVATANGLLPDARVIAGSTITLPDDTAPVAEGAAAPAVATQIDGAPEAQAPGAMGAYTVQPGDTLSALAAQYGSTVEALVAMNGLGAAAPLVSGTAIKLPTGAQGGPGDARAEPEPATEVVEGTSPAPTGGSVSADQIAQIANQHGVPPGLATAIAYQESGFNNAVVSSANARGVMQVMPGTWTWVQGNLARRTLDPDAPLDNVHAGVLYLKRMLDMAGGDPSLAAAGYYQGMASVRRIGMYDDTQRYVANVLALRSRFTGAASGGTGTGGG
ncbi:MAG: transglycosylase SLT domain-containing protein [Solirubrobacteraceae bacterium MAG38_C4-C5]|nr:transglycosylase SLT domain-containing protein [Candidatus Siliceabacter maunaloa]